MSPTWPWPLANPATRRALGTLLKVLRGIPLTGWEASCKFSPQGLLPGRLLTGFSPRAVSGRYLAGLPHNLGMPQPLARSFAEEWPRCNRVLLAFETGITDTLLKAYLEYPVPVPGKTLKPCLAIRGFKWNPDKAASDWHETKYWCLNGLTPGQALELLLQSTPQTAEWGLLQHWLAEALEHACRQARHWPHFRMLNSSDSCSPRNAINLRFYDSGLKVCTLNSQIRQLTRHWGIPAADTARFLLGAQDREIGWLQAGIADNDLPFMTLYCTATRADAGMALSQDERQTDC